MRIALRRLLDPEAAKKEEERKRKEVRGDDGESLVGCRKAQQAPGVGACPPLWKDPPLHVADAALLPLQEEEKKRAAETAAPKKAGAWAGLPGRG